MYKDPTSIFDNNRLDIDDNDTLRGDKSICKGIDRLSSRKLMKDDVAYNVGNLRESILKTPSTEGEYPPNTSDAYSIKHLLNTVHRDNETGLIYRVIDIFDDRQLRLAKCRRETILPDGDLSILYPLTRSM